MLMELFGSVIAPYQLLVSQNIETNDVFHTGTERGRLHSKLLAWVRIPW